MMTDRHGHWIHLCEATIIVFGIGCQSPVGSESGDLSQEVRVTRTAVEGKATPPSPLANVIDGETRATVDRLLGFRMDVKSNSEDHYQWTGVKPASFARLRVSLIEGGDSSNMAGTYLQNARVDQPLPHKLPRQMEPGAIYRIPTVSAFYRVGLGRDPAGRVVKGQCIGAFGVDLRLSENGRQEFEIARDGIQETRDNSVSLPAQVFLDSGWASLSAHPMCWRSVNLGLILDYDGSEWFVMIGGKGPASDLQPLVARVARATGNGPFGYDAPAAFTDYSIFEGETLKVGSLRLEPSEVVSFGTVSWVNFRSLSSVSSTELRPARSG